MFPVFYAWYDANPLGTLTLKNGGKDAITGITVSFFMKKYMDAVVSSAVPGRLEPGKELVVPLKAIFNESILGIDTLTKKQAQITVDYQVGNEKKQAKVNPSVSLEGRNGMNWIDDRRAAAFVTQKDQPVIVWARNVWSAVQGEGSKVIDENLRKAMAIHEAIRLYQMVYSKDPQTPYTGSAEKKADVDFLQFPRETLQYKIGDCDDLSILYCALLESLGVETAFITVPGHIYTAIRSRRDARRRLARSTSTPTTLSSTEDKAWVPVEVTKLGDADDFVEAWSTGAKEWSRRAVEEGQAALIPLRAAQSEYAPVNLPTDDATPPVVPGPADLVDAGTRTSTIKFLDRRDVRAARRAEQEGEGHERRSQGRSTRWGSSTRSTAATRRRRSSSRRRRRSRRRKYVSPLLNLGQIALFEERSRRGERLLHEARRRSSRRTRLALLGIARANHELENYGAVTHGVRPS